MAKLCCTWLGIVAIFGVVVVPALAPGTPKAKPINPTKVIADKNLKRLPRTFIKASLHGRHRPSFVITLHFLRCGVCSKRNLSTTLTEQSPDSVVGSGRMTEGVGSFGPPTVERKWQSSPFGRSRIAAPPDTRPKIQ